MKGMEMMSQASDTTDLRKSIAFCAQSRCPSRQTFLVVGPLDSFSSVKGTLSNPKDMKACVDELVRKACKWWRHIDPEGGWNEVEDFEKTKTLNDSIYRARSFHGLKFCGNLCNLVPWHGGAPMVTYTIIKRARDREINTNILKNLKKFN